MTAGCQPTFLFIKQRLFFEVYSAKIEPITSVSQNSSVPESKKGTYANMFVFKLLC